MNSSPRILVLGATGSIGYAVAANLLGKGWPVTVLVRSVDKARQLFAAAPNLTIEQGDVQDLPRLLAVSRGHDVLFHGINYPYNEWEGNMARATANIIQAAQAQCATVVLPGNIYNFGNAAAPIREDTKPNPCTRKGALRVALEAQLAEAARAGHCRVLTVRLPDFWGPAALNAGTIPIFEGALTGKAMPWLANADIPHQFVYTPDAAEIISRLLLAGAPQQPYEVVNYGGTTVPSVRSFFAQIAAAAGQPMRLMVIKPWQVALLGLFQPVVREVREMLYLYQHPVVLDDAAVRQRFPDFRTTPLSAAIATTLRWFAEHRLSQVLEPAADKQAAMYPPVKSPAAAGGW